MNRRTILKSIVLVPFLSLPSNADKVNTWMIIGKRRIRPNTQNVTFAISSEIAGINKLGIEVKGNSLWLYELTAANQNGVSNTRPVNLNIPPRPNGCTERVSAVQLCEKPKKIQLRFESLPITNKPTEILLWGST
jgi:hypothetical protein